ncbi:MAG: hypothetical protein JSV63_00280 [Candidatus Aenigmatarchaeota archaeon]|nr:MAG: hypothetical protein JSV63_00280 [Candidatus Aenigmarchaeota archaeon]
MVSKLKIISVSGVHELGFESSSECRESLEVWRDALRVPESRVVNTPTSAWRANNIIGVVRVDE